MSNLPDAQKKYLHQVMDQLMGDLSYPQDKEGNTLDINLMKATVAYHLVRAGWRKPNNTDGLPLDRGVRRPADQAAEGLRPRCVRGRLHLGARQRP